jgi:ABC-2 type transport system ATP-binding protein
MKRRLDLGASLVAGAPVLLLDEPTTGLDPRARLDLWAYLRELVQEGTSVLLTTQYLEEADQMADEIVVIDRGTVIASGTPTELKQRVGGEVVEATFTTPEDTRRAAELLGPVGADVPHTDLETNVVSVSVHHGAVSLIDAAKRLDEAGLEVVDLALRRPSLDDAFLALTGHATAQGGPAASGGAEPVITEGARS